MPTAARRYSAGSAHPGVVLSQLPPFLSPRLVHAVSGAKSRRRSLEANRAQALQHSALRRGPFERLLPDADGDDLDMNFTPKGDHNYLLVYMLQNGAFNTHHFEKKLSLPSYKKTSSQNDSAFDLSLKKLLWLFS